MKLTIRTLDWQFNANALTAGEIDLIEMPAFELYRSLKKQSAYPDARTQSAGRPELPAVQSTPTAFRRSEGAAGSHGRVQSADVPAGASGYSRTVSHLFL